MTPSQPSADTPSDTQPDYFEFLPKGTTQFGVLDETNEAAFLAQFPELNSRLVGLKNKIKSFKRELTELEGDNVEELIDAVDWSIYIEPIDRPGLENSVQPNEVMFVVRCHYEEQQSFLERARKSLLWKKQLPQITGNVEFKNEDSTQRYKRAADAINVEVAKWGERDTVKKLTPDRLNEFVPVLRSLAQSQKTFSQRGGRTTFIRNIDILEKEGRQMAETHATHNYAKRAGIVMEHVLPDTETLAFFDQNLPNPKESPHDQPNLFFYHDPREGAMEAMKQAEKDRARERALLCVAPRSMDLEGDSNIAIGRTRDKTRRSLAPLLLLGAALAVGGVGLGKWLKSLDNQEETPSVDENNESEQEKFQGLMDALYNSVGRAFTNFHLRADFEEFGNSDRIYRYILDDFSADPRVRERGFYALEINFETHSKDWGKEYSIDVSVPVYQLSEDPETAGPRYEVKMNYGPLYLEEGKTLVNRTTRQLDYWTQRIARGVFFQVTGNGLAADAWDTPVEFYAYLSGQFIESFDALGENEQVPYIVERIAVLPVGEDELEFVVTFSQKGIKSDTYETRQLIPKYPRQHQELTFNIELEPLPESVKEVVDDIFTIETKALIELLITDNVLSRPFPDIGVFEPGNVYLHLLHDLRFVINRRLRDRDAEFNGLRCEELNIYPEDISGGRNKLLITGIFQDSEGMYSTMVEVQ